MQSLRILGRYNDSIPLTLWADEQLRKDLEHYLQIQQDLLVKFENETECIISGVMENMVVGKKRSPKRKCTKKDKFKKSTNGRKETLKKTTTVEITEVYRKDSERKIRVVIDETGINTERPEVVEEERPEVEIKLILKDRLQQSGQKIYDLLIKELEYSQNQWYNYYDIVDKDAYLTQPRLQKFLFNRQAHCDAVEENSLGLKVKKVDGICFVKYN